jgi:hypothetical protein
MPKTSVKTFLILIHKLNDEMDAIAELGQELLRSAQDIDFTSVTDIVKEEEIKELFDETGKKYIKLHDMKEVLLGGLQARVIQEMNDAKPISKTRSLSRKRKNKSRSFGKTQRARSI